MGKKNKFSRLGAQASRPGSLFDQINQDESVQPTGRIKSRYQREETEDEYVGGELGRNILKQSLAQLQELENETEESGAQQCKSSDGKSRKAIKLDGGSDEEDLDLDDEELEVALPQNIDKIVDDFETELNLDENDRKILEHFMKKDAEPQRRLADIFKEKITEKQTEIQSQVDTGSVGGASNINPEVIEMCEGVGRVLAKYRSGKLPKIFKVIPKMRNWEELVYLTGPDKWSAAAMYQATRIFASNLNAPMAQRFFNLVLLPRVRDDISYYKRLNFHLYRALGKALFKPGAFFKGILLPLCVSGNCSLREAIIIGSVIAKTSIPILHSSAAMLKIAEMDYSGSNSIFLRIFFDKMYALPYRVVDACLNHFVKFHHDTRELPLLWHQALLVFIQRYKEDLSQDQKDAILEVVKFHGHYKITSEVRRELTNSKCRGEEESEMVVD